MNWFIRIIILLICLGGGGEVNAIPVSQESISDMMDCVCDVIMCMTGSLSWRVCRAVTGRLGWFRRSQEMGEEHELRGNTETASDGSLKQCFPWVCGR